jgi:hypothetical protein
MNLYYDRKGEPIGSEQLSDALANNAVGKTQVGGYDVSTVYVGVNHNFGDGPPLIFETMVFQNGSARDEFMERYSTEDEAKRGHENIVGMVAALEGVEPSGEVSQVVEAGALVRPRLKAMLDVLGVEWTEHKGILTSSFVVRGAAEKMARLNAWLREQGEGK